MLITGGRGYNLAASWQDFGELPDDQMLAHHFLETQDFGRKSNRALKILSKFSSLKMQKNKSWPKTKSLVQDSVAINIGEAHNF